MPNWVLNKVFASEVVLNAMTVAGKVDFEAIVPMPEKLKEQSLISFSTASTAESVSELLSAHISTDVLTAESVTMFFSELESQLRAPSGAVVPDGLYKPAIEAVLALPGSKLENLCETLLGCSYKPSHRLRNFVDYHLNGMSESFFIQFELLINGIDCREAITAAPSDMNEADWVHLEAALGEQLWNFSLPRWRRGRKFYR